VIEAARGRQYNRPKRNNSSTAIEELREENDRLKERLYIQTQLSEKYKREAKRLQEVAMNAANFQRTTD